MCGAHDRSTELPRGKVWDHAVKIRRERVSDYLSTETPSLPPPPSPSTPFSLLALPIFLSPSPPFLLGSPSPFFFFLFSLLLSFLFFFSLLCFFFFFFFCFFFFFFFFWFDGTIGHGVLGLSKRLLRVRPLPEPAHLHGHFVHFRSSTSCPLVVTMNGDYSSELPTSHQILAFYPPVPSVNLAMFPSCSGRLPALFRARSSYYSRLSPPTSDVQVRTFLDSSSS